MELCVDLCSGLGGFSQAFVDASWNVVRIDNNPKFKDVPHTVIADIRDIERIKRIVGKQKVRIILASPPCNRFSLANSTQFPKKGIRLALELVGCCLEIIRELEPKYWILENPKGRLRWFIGKPRNSIRLIDYGYKTMKPTDLWGNVPFRMLEHQKSWSYTHKSKGWGYDVSRKASERAKMPLGLSEAILKSVA